MAVSLVVACVAIYAHEWGHALVPLVLRFPFCVGPNGTYAAALNGSEWVRVVPDRPAQLMMSASGPLTTLILGLLIGGGHVLRMRRESPWVRICALAVVVPHAATSVGQLLSWRIGSSATADEVKLLASGEAAWLLAGAALLAVQGWLVWSLSRRGLAVGTGLSPGALRSLGKAIGVVMGIAGALVALSLIPPGVSPYVIVLLLAIAATYLVVWAIRNVGRVTGFWAAPCATWRRFVATETGPALVALVVLSQVWTWLWGDTLSLQRACEFCVHP